MLLVDATYIHDGGTKVLLYYLIEEITRNNIETFYLIDDRLNIADIAVAIQYKKISGIRYYQRHQFFRSNKSKFRKVLCFNNIPPTVRLNCKVFTYLQSVFYFKISANFSLWQKLLFFIRRQLFGFTKRNTDNWIVQSDWMRSTLSNTYRIGKERISVIPVFKDEAQVGDMTEKEKNTFLYASNALTHKNHIMLINAFCKFYDEHKTGKLVLTVNNIYKNVYCLIEQKKATGYPIENIGFVSREMINKFYTECEYYIHPSLAESFGLGLIESIKFGCKVLGADLPYTFEVCKPSAIFNPYSEKSIQNIFALAATSSLPNSITTVKDNMGQLISILQKQ